MQPIISLNFVHNQRGNVLFIILIAVALFAALSYAVTSSTRSGGDTSKENNSLIASQMLQYGTSIENAIAKMKMLNGCTDSQISFENPFIAGYANSNAPANYSCHVFRTEGGGIVWQDAPAGITNSTQNYFFSGRMSFVSRNPSATTPPEDAIDLMMGLQDISLDICSAINQKTFGNPAAIDLLHIEGSQRKFTGSYVWGHSHFYHGKDINALCMTNTTSSGGPATMTNKLHFIKILIPR